MKTAFITGVSSGIGFELCKLFVENGFFTYGMGRKSPTLKSDNFKFIENDFNRFKPFEVSDKIDCLVLNSGITVYKKVCSLSEKDIRKVFEVNFLGNALTLNSLCGKLKKDSVVFFISSIASVEQNVFENWGIYSSLKTGFEKYLRVFAFESGIRTVILRVGAVDTPLWNCVKGKEREGRKLPPSRIAEILMDMYLKRDNLTFDRMVCVKEIKP